MTPEQKLKLLQKLVNWVTRAEANPKIDELWKQYADILAKWDATAQEVEGQLFYMAPEIKSVMTAILVYADTEDKAKFESLFPEIFGAPQTPKAANNLQAKHDDAVKKLTEQAQGC